METSRRTPNGGFPEFVYSEVEPFEGWKLRNPIITPRRNHKSIARLNPLRDGNTISTLQSSGKDGVYSEVEPFEGWKLIIQINGDAVDSGL